MEDKQEEQSNRKPEKGVKERCDGKEKRNVPPEPLVIDICYVALCVLVFHADLKPLLWGAYVKDHRPPDVMPPGSPHISPHLSWPHFLINFFSPCQPPLTPSVSALHQLSPSFTRTQGGTDPPGLDPLFNPLAISIFLPMSISLFLPHLLSHLLNFLSINEPSILPEVRAYLQGHEDMTANHKARKESQFITFEGHSLLICIISAVIDFFSSMGGLLGNQTLLFILAQIARASVTKTWKQLVASSVLMLNVNIMATCVDNRPPTEWWTILNLLPSIFSNRSIFFPPLSPLARGSKAQGLSLLCMCEIYSYMLCTVYHSRKHKGGLLAVRTSLEGTLSLSSSQIKFSLLLPFLVMTWITALYTIVMIPASSLTYTKSLAEIHANWQFCRMYFCTL